MTALPGTAAGIAGVCAGPGDPHDPWGSLPAEDTPQARRARPYLLLALLCLLRALLAGGVGGGGGGGRLLLEQAGRINSPGSDSVVLVRDHSWTWNTARAR